MKLLRFVISVWILLLSLVLSSGVAQISTGQLVSLASKPAPAPDHWLGIIGKYTHGDKYLLLWEQGGQLLFTTSDAKVHPLREISPNVFVINSDTAYLVFSRSNGIVCELENLTYQKEPAATFIIHGAGSLENLREQALKSQCPSTGGDFLPVELVDLSLLQASLRFDIRYATTNNFIGMACYESPKAFLQKPVAQALLRAHRKLAKWGYGILVYDAYRPWYVTKMFWDATPASQKDYVADPAKGSRHNRGAAVDVNLYDLATGKPVSMPSAYDDFSECAHVDYPGGTSLQRWHRSLLRMAMEEEGFCIYPQEWWHFDYRDWQKYPVLNISFAELCLSDTHHSTR